MLIYRTCGRGSVGRAQPCQGWGRGFEPRRPLHFFMATWPSGKAEACKAFISGSNPDVASKFESPKSYIKPHIYK